MISSQQISLISKAFPYMPAHTQHYIDILLKANQLQQSMQNTSFSSDINICSDKSTQPFRADAFLRDIKPALSKNEQKNVDTVLNLLKTVDIINTYKGMSFNSTDSFYDELFKNTQYQK